MRKTYIHPMLGVVSGSPEDCIATSNLIFHPTGEGDPISVDFDSMFH